MIPGYDFTQTENVTAANMLKWLVGAYITSPVAMSSMAMGSGASLTGMSNEGDLELSTNTGKIYVKTRFGMVPVFGGGFFTKRIYTIPEGASDYNQIRFYSPLCSVKMWDSRLSVTDTTALERGFEHAMLMGTRTAGTRGYAIGSAVLWPSRDNYDDTGYDITETTSYTGMQRLLCLQGFTPMYMTVVTGYTHHKPGSTGSVGQIRFRATGGESWQPSYGVMPIFPIPNHFMPAASGVSDVGWGFLWSCIGTSSLGSHSRIHLEV